MSDEKPDVLSKPKTLQTVCHYSVQIRYNHDTLNSKLRLHTYLWSEIKSAAVTTEYIRCVKGSFWTDYMKHNKHEIHFIKHYSHQNSPWLYEYVNHGFHSPEQSIYDFKNIWVSYSSIFTCISSTNSHEDHLQTNFKLSDLCLV